MKPTLNYGLSDSLIDVVRKAVKEAKLHSNQQKLDVHEPEKDELTSQDFKKLRAGKKVKDGIDTKPKLKEEEQIDELSVNKMLKYTDAANKNREVLNKKWDTGTATEREQNKVLGHEAGVDRAAARVKAKTGKNPNEIGKLSRMKYAVTKEEEQMDETEEQIDELSRGTLKSYVKKAIKSAKHYSFEPAVRDPKSGNQYRPTYTKRSKGIDLAKDKLKREEVEQMNEANSDNPAYEKDLIKIDMHHYKEADQHRRTLRTLGTQGKLNTPEGKFHKAALEKHQAALNAMASSDHESMRKKLKMRSLKKEEVEQMDESLDSIAKKHDMKYTTTAYGAGMKHPTKGEISINRYGEWHHKGTNKTGDSENDFSSLDKHLSTVKEEEQIDEVKLADLPRRMVKGTSYGANYVDPEGADDADDMKKAEPKRKSGPQGTMKRRFIKDKSKLRMQFK